MKRYVPLLVGLFILMQYPLATLYTGSPEEELHTIFNDFWEYSLEQNPLFATSVGVHRFNDRLPVVTIERYEQHKQHVQEFLGRIENVPRNELSGQDVISYEFFIQILNEQTGELEFNTYYLPITNRSGFHISFPELSERVPLQTVRDYEHYIARLNGFKEYTRQHIEIMRKGIRNGFTLPRVVLEDADLAIEPHIVEDPRPKVCCFAPSNRFQSISLKVNGTD